MKKRKYNNGGLLEQILPAALSFIPGGNAISPFLQMAMQNSNQPKAYQPRPAISTNPFGMQNGGPIAPMSQESTYIKPTPFLPTVPVVPPITNVLQDPNYQNQQMRAANTFNPLTGLGMYDANGGSGKSKSKFRYHEKALGGSITNDNFKQYSTGSHTTGNDTEIDQFGNPVESGVAAIQNKENMYKGFVYSDTLKNPETGNKFNTDAMKLNKKHKNARLDDITKSTLDFEMGRLAALNQEKIDKVSTKMARGGIIKPPQFQFTDPMDAYNQAYQFNYGEDPNVIQPIGMDNTQMQSGQIMTDRSITPQLPTLNLRSGVNSTTVPQLNLKQSFPVNTTTDTTNQLPTGSTVSNTTPRGLGTLDAIGLGLKGAALIGSIGDALNPAEVENPILPNYSKARQYLQSANIDYSQAEQNALGVSNMQSNAIRSMSNNPSAYLSRQSGRLGQLQDALSSINQQEANSQSQLNVQKGQFEGNVAVDNANRLTQNRINNQMNLATSNSFDRSLMSDLSQIGSQFREESVVQQAIANNKSLNQFTNSQILFALNNKFPNFTFSDDVIEKFKKGEINIDNLVNYKS